MGRRVAGKSNAEMGREQRKRIPEIIERMIEGESLRQICRSEGMPHIATFLVWVSKDEELAKQYSAAIQLRADSYFEEIFDIADDARNDWMERETKSGEVIEVVNREAIQRSALRVDARKWALARMNPKKYGDKVDLNHGGRVKVVSVDRDDEAL